MEEVQMLWTGAIENLRAVEVLMTVWKAVL